MLRQTAPEMPADTYERKLYTGILKMYVEAINPTDAERIEMGIITQKLLDEGRAKPASYRDTHPQNGHERMRLDFHLRFDMTADNGTPDPLRVRHSVWVSKVPVGPSKAGKFQVLNAARQSAWVDEQHLAAGTAPLSKDGKPWFATPYRRAFEGEVALMETVAAWTNQGKDDQPVAYDFNAICQGDIRSLNAVFGSKDGKGKSRDNYVKVALGVKNGERDYQVCHRNLYRHWEPEEKIYKEILASGTTNDFGIAPNTPYVRGAMELRPWMQYGSAPVTTASRVPVEPYPASAAGVWQQPETGSYKDRLVAASVAAAEGDDDLPF